MKKSRRQVDQARAFDGNAGPDVWSPGEKYAVVTMGAGFIGVVRAVLGRCAGVDVLDPAQIGRLGAQGVSVVVSLMQIPFDNEVVGLIETGTGVYFLASIGLFDDRVA